MSYVVCNQPGEFHDQCGKENSGSIVHLNVTKDLDSLEISGAMNDQPPSFDFNPNDYAS